MSANAVRSARDISSDAGTIPRAVLRQLSVLDTGRALRAVGIDWLLLLSCYVAISSSAGLPLKIAAGALAAIQMHRLAIFGHEGAHHLISKTRLVNDGVTNIFCFYMFGITVAGYRHWHFAHHRLVGTGRDTELLFKNGWRYTRPKSRKAFLGMFIFDLVGGGADEVSKLAWASRPRTLRDAVGVAMYWGVIVGVLMATHNVMLAFIHLGLILTAFWAIFRIRGWSEHVGAIGPSYTHRFSVNKVLAYIFFPHHTWMHCEHHRFPTVPAHNLPRAREILGSKDILNLNGLFVSFASVSQDVLNPPPSGTGRSTVPK